jgi:hypothetical protein
MDICLLCLYVALSWVGRGLCDGLITRPEKSYRACNCTCDHRNPEKGPVLQAGNDRKMDEWMNEWIHKKQVKYWWGRAGETVNVPSTVVVVGLLIQSARAPLSWHAHHFVDFLDVSTELHGGKLPWYKL